ncbi:MAG: penicillin-binding transpeptidase domain-containing protein [Patescibacteria group bacterium]
MHRAFFNRRRRYQEIEPDEILIDSANLPAFDTSRLEGRIERPVGANAFRGFFALVVLVGIIFAGALINLQVMQYAPLVARAEANRLAHSIIIADRGLITDRNGVVLASNTLHMLPVASSTVDSKENEQSAFTTRDYPLGSAGAIVVGYVSYPKADQNGYWYQEQTEGVIGIESLYNTALAGTNGLQIAETNAQGDTVSGSMVRVAEAGADIHLSLDAGIQEALYGAIANRSEESGWRGGSGVIMDIETGELLAVVSYPSFDPEVMSSGTPKESVAKFLTSDRSPFLDRAVSGLYTPGSVVKPFVASAALQERIITPDKQILSTGSISIPNPYDPTKPTIFKDWRANGWTDVRHAIAVSSDVYFYAVGGGYKDQPGLGIAAIEKYMRMFGFGKETGAPIAGEEFGTIPNPEWKANMFDGERWFLGNTYHTAIGQYGFQVTPMQLVHSIASIANGGTLVTPVIEAGKTGLHERVAVSADNLRVVREGMRLAVTEGIAQALAVPGVHAGAKTGTAEIGAHKEFTNSLVVGFFPYENPKYAFAVVMERAKAGTLQGAPSVMGEVLRFVVAERPEMTK